MIALGATKDQPMTEKEPLISYVRVSILGSAPGGEIWSINPVFDPTGEFPGSVDQQALDDAALAIANLNPGAQLLSFMSSALSITGARVEVRDDATDDLIAISVQGRGSALTGSGTPLRGAQTAVVVSLRTNTPGGSGRGRIYWPAVGTAVSTTLRFDASFITAALTQVSTYLHAMEAALATEFPTIGFDLAVRSRTTHTTPHVNTLRIGDIPDTQRRRRDKMVEAYQTAAF